MMNIYEIVLSAVLFFVLAPNALFTALPDLIGISTKDASGNANTFIQAAIHAIVFTLLLYLSTIYMPM